MIEYLHDVVKGTVGKLSDNFEILLEKTVNFDESTMKWIVSGEVILKVKNYTCVGNPIFTLTVDGVDEANALKLYEIEVTDGEYILGAFTSIYQADFKNKSVPVSSVFMLDANGDGPGTCLVSDTIELPATLNAKGILVISNIGASIISFSVKNLAPTIGYNRTLEVLYKKSTDVNYSFLDLDTLEPEATEYTRQISGLTPGVSYDFRCNLYDDSNKLLNTMDRSFVLALDMPKLDVLYQTTSSVMLKASTLTSVVDYDRTFKLKYRIKGSFNWTEVPKTYTIPSFTEAGEYIFDVTGLAIDTYYEFALECYAVETIEYTLTVLSKTKSENEESDSVVITVDNGQMSYSITNTKLNAGTKNLHVYVQNDFNYMFVGTYTSEFFKSGYQFVVTPDVSPEVQALINTEGVIFKLFFSDSTTSIIEDIRYVIGG